MIAALGNPRPFDDPARETELYFAGDRVNRCKPLRPQPPLHGVLVAAEQESKRAYSVAERFPAGALAEAQRLRRERVAFRKSHWVHGTDFDRALASESHAEHAGRAPAQWARARRHLRSGDEVYARSLPQQGSGSGSGGGSGGSDSGSGEGVGGSGSGQRGGGAGVGWGGSGDLTLLRQKRGQQQRPGTTGQAAEVGGWRGGSSRGSGGAVPRSSQVARVAAPTRAASPSASSSASSSASGDSKHSSPRNVWQFQTSYGAGVGASHAPGSSVIVPTFVVRSSKSSRGTL
jgi:hypothetical protein